MSTHALPSELATPMLFPTQSVAFGSPEGWHLGFGTTVPTDGDKGWAPGALFIHSDGNSAATLVYFNRGNSAVADFDPIDLSQGVEPPAALADVTPGTAAASKALVLDSNKDVGEVNELSVVDLVASGEAEVNDLTVTGDAEIANATFSGVVLLPESDPGVAGALWNDGGEPAISTGE